MGLEDRAVFQKLPVLLGVLFLVIGCMQPSSTENVGTVEQVAENRSRPYVEGVAALNRYSAESKCDNQHSSIVQDKISELEYTVSTFKKFGMSKYIPQAREMHTSLAFNYANEALKKGCLNDSVLIYRRLFTFYTGSAYSGIRDNAKLGMEDVRVARKLSPTTQ